MVYVRRRQFVPTGARSVRRRPLAAGGARPAILTPTKWLAKFTSACRACRQTMEAGTMVEGVRPEDGRWEVWHDQPSCPLVAQQHNYFLPDALKPAMAADVSAKKAMRATVEDEWLKEFDENAS